MGLQKVRGACVGRAWVGLGCEVEGFSRGARSSCVEQVVYHLRRLPPPLPKRSVLIVEPTSDWPRRAPEGCRKSAAHWYNTATLPRFEPFHDLNASFRVMCVRVCMCKHACPQKKNAKKKRTLIPHAAPPGRLRPRLKQPPWTSKWSSGAPRAPAPLSTACAAAAARRPRAARTLPPPRSWAPRRRWGGEAAQKAWGGRTGGRGMWGGCGEADRCSRETPRAPRRI